MIAAPPAAETAPAWLITGNSPVSAVLANYRVRPLTPERIPEAYPVVAFLDAELTAQRWADYACAVLGPDGDSESHGILTLEDRQGRIVGLSAYAIRPDLHRRRVMVIENFAVVTLLGGQQAASILLTAMEQLARQRACQCLAVSLLEEGAPRSLGGNRNQTRQFFKGAGFRLDLRRFCKCFEPARAEDLQTLGLVGASKSPDLRP